MKPVASPIRNNSRRFFIATSNETAKSDYKYVCLRKNKLDVPKHSFFHRNAYSSVRFRWFSLLNLGTLMVGYWTRSDKNPLWISCLVWRGGVTARWRQHGVTLIGAQRLEWVRSRHGDAYTHLLGIYVVLDTPWYFVFSGTSIGPASLPVSYPWQQFFSVSTISPIILQKKLLAPRSGAKM